MQAPLPNLDQLQTKTHQATLQGWPLWAYTKSFLNSFSALLYRSEPVEYADLLNEGSARLWCVTCAVYDSAML